MSSLKMWETYLDLSGDMVESVLVESARMVETVKLRVCWLSEGWVLEMIEEKTAGERGKLRMGVKRYMGVLQTMLLVRNACGRSRAMSRIEMPYPVFGRGTNVE